MGNTKQVAPENALLDIGQEMPWQPTAGAMPKEPVVLWVISSLATCNLQYEAAWPYHPGLREQHI